MNGAENLVFPMLQFQKVKFLGGVGIIGWSVKPLSVFTGKVFHVSSLINIHAQDFYSLPDM
jgi:hypothetical protein